MAELYRSEDAQQILQLAIARQSEAGELTRAQLFEIAAELNISVADLEAAEQEWLTQRGELEERRTFTRLRQGKFHRRFAKYAIVNGFLMALNFITLAGLTWSLYIALFWGIGVALDAWRTYYIGKEEFEEAFQRWRQRRQLTQSVSSLLNRLFSGR
ncbi:MAG: 2TM domain-containing protein [Cyanobacteria bacterium CRU_2_1]|nr:2TM domain-containing protein [Cyanobacteria bacterium RU_5_0]NJR59217.1 2TM domain-containing protein [Cyanobacteria bacterium CRU_2_1]